MHFLLADYREKFRWEVLRQVPLSCSKFVQATNLLAWHNTNVLSYSSGDQKWERALEGSHQVVGWAVFLLEAQRENVSLPFPASRGIRKPWPVAPGQQPHHSDLCFSASDSPVFLFDLKKILVIALGPLRLSRINFPIWGSLIWWHLQSPLRHVKYHVHWFWGLDMDGGRRRQYSSVYHSLLGIWGWSIRVGSGCLPEDTLIIKVSKPSLLSLLILLATYFHFCISRLTILSCFISPCLWSNIVQDKTSLIPKRDKGAATGLHKRKIISECKFTNFVQNILGNSDSQIVSISIPGTFAH